ncbi:ROK family transcriptional regulator [Cryobacterium sp. PH31-L1]|uniref:ROK family transcriptional regulator n=1 Tax=Cryobacterium sp. PH31-L1 TaxID=3046199 RepID=UPI0024BBA09B|nr:ROK family transcriptional regulator [Cryobacterium sp. PH31-L1]
MTPLMGPVAGKKFLPEHTRRHNRALVLQTLYRGAQLSRADIARATGLTRVTVSDLIGELIDDTLVRELGRREDARPGKPATVLDINAAAFTIIGIDLSQPALFRGALLDLNGEILRRAETRSPDARGVVAVDAVLDLIAELAERSPSPLLGIGIGSPGIINERGVVLQATNLGWTNEDLADTVSRRFGVVAVVMNDADAAAIAERAWGDAAADVIVVRVGRGLGAGVIVNGQLVRGSRFAAGEIGHVVVGTDGGALCTCGKTGCLETWLSVPAIRGQLNRAGSDEVTNAVREAAGVRLGIALAPVVGMLNVSEIVLSGPPDVLTDRMLTVTEQTIAARTMAVDGAQVPVRLSDLGDDGVLRGVAAQVLTSQLGIS